MNETGRTRVILVVKQPGNIRVLQQAIAEVDLIGIGVSSEDELMQELQRDHPAQRALVDVTDFGREAWRLCELLQEHDITFIVLSTAKDTDIGNRSILYGAVSVLQKPVAKRALLELVQNLSDR